MKHITRALSLAALVCATLAQAGHLENHSYQVNVGPTINYARFKFGQRIAPVVAGQSLLEAKGWMVGVHADFIYEHACNVFARLRFDGRWSAADINQFDYITTPGAVTVNRQRVQDYRPELNIGYTFAFGDCDQIEVAPYVGVGGIILESRNRRQVTLPAPFNGLQPRTRRTDIFVPIGVDVDWKRNAGFDIGLNAEYRIGVQSRYQVRTFVPAPVTTVRTKVGRADSFLIEVPLTWHNETCHCFDWQFKLVPLFDWTRWGDRRDVPVTTANSLRLQQYYAGVHFDFGVSF